jgi:BatD DUF11 like domain
MLVSALTMSALAFAKTEDFYMLADRTQVGTEDTFVVEIVLSNPPEGAALSLPKPGDFEIISRNESSQISIVNGLMKQGRKFELVLRATKPGKLTIPPAVLQSKEGTIKTESITLDVVKGRTAPTRRERRQASNPFGLPPGFRLPPGFQLPPGFSIGDEDDESSEEDNVRPEKGADSDLFVKAVADKTEAFVGEEIGYTLYIYSRIELAQVNGAKLPKFEGFWSPDTQTPNELRPSEAVLNGVRYSRYLIRQKALFAMKPGSFEIEPADIEVTTGFMFAGRQLSRRSNAIKLKINPLPPPNTTANVGRWRLLTQATQTKVQIGEPVQLKVVLEGKGFLSAVEVPKLQAPSGLRAFDPQVTDKPDYDGHPIGGRRTLEYVLVPERTGVFTIPGFSFRYFDPKTKKYEESKTDDISIEVTANASAGSSGVGTGGVGGPKNELKGKGMRPPRTSAQFVARSAPLFERTWFVPLSVAPVALALMFSLVSLVFRPKSLTALELNKKAKAARKRLAQAHRFKEKGTTAQFYAEVERAVLGFIEAKTSLPALGFNRLQLDEALKAHGLPDEERARLLALLERCDFGRYAPGMGEAKARSVTLSDAESVMEALS